MGVLVKLFVLAVAVLIGLFFSGILFPLPEAPAPVDGWWGRGPRQPDSDTTLREFKVSVSDAELQDLYERLDRARFGEDLIDTEFQYGFPTREIRKIAQYWRKEYNWRQHEAELNSFPQFKTTIEGIEIHFLHVKPKSGRQGKPLLIVHGWPGSVWEFHKVIPMLTDPARFGRNEKDEFEIIAPSIPGYGFSEAPHRQGFASLECAGIFVKLMERLGHRKFYAQGGDWGGIITLNMVLVYPERLYGCHNNMVIQPFWDPVLMVHQIGASLAPELVLGKEHAKYFKPLSENFPYLMQETGYFHLQATKPDTVGIGLNDSPIGLAGYILEKFSTWTNRTYVDLPDGGLTRKFTMDDLLTNVMIYWINGNIASSQRLYKEYLLKSQKTDRVPAKVPYGLAACPGDLFSTIRPFAEYKYKDIVQFTYMPKAGHFFAFEEPQMLVEDFLSFVHKVEARDRIVYPSWIQSDAKIVKTAEPPKQETRRDSQGKKERPRQETKEADKVTSKEQKAKDTKKTQKSDKDSKDGKKRQKSNNE